MGYRKILQEKIISIGYLTPHRIFQISYRILNYYRKFLIKVDYLTCQVKLKKKGVLSSLILRLFSEVSAGRGRFCQNQFGTIVKESVLMINISSMSYFFAQCYQVGKLILVFYINIIAK